MKPVRFVAIAIIVLTACGEPASVATTGAAAPAVTSSTAPSDPVAEELRELGLAYWDAFNAYDADLVLSYLEETYGTARQEIIRSEINQIRTFGVQLGVQEEGPPVLLSDNTGEMYLGLKNPLGVRRIRMEFQKIDGDWAITFAEETD